ncbi:MAG TPA: hypothetical protein VJ840_00890 [Gemmatimonadaceae bacterium]|nr:hypothetical protein [Gemmatimonadaceae bacterium]
MVKRIFRVAVVTLVLPFASCGVTSTTSEVESAPVREGRVVIYRHDYQHSSTGGSWAEWEAVYERPRLVFFSHKKTLVGPDREHLGVKGVNDSTVQISGTPLSGGGPWRKFVIPRD